jgi:hypothetical protein
MTWPNARGWLSRTCSAGIVFIMPKVPNAPEGVCRVKDQQLGEIVRSMPDGSRDVRRRDLLALLAVQLGFDPLADPSIVLAVALLAQAQQTRTANGIQQGRGPGVPPKRGRRTLTGDLKDALASLSDQLGGPMRTAMLMCAIGLDRSKGFIGRRRAPDDEAFDATLVLRRLSQRISEILKSSNEPEQPSSDPRLEGAISVRRREDRIELSVVLASAPRKVKLLRQSRVRLPALVWSEGEERYVRRQRSFVEREYLQDDGSTVVQLAPLAATPDALPSDSKAARTTSLAVPE